MRVIEEPFMTRNAILAVLRPGLLATESPFRTLRQHRFASDGLRIDVRTTLGQVLGRAHFYSALNADAARAVRLGDKSLAQQLAARAGEIELSPPAETIRDAVQDIGASMSADPLFADAPISLQRYMRLRGRSSWPVFDKNALAHEWLVHSAAWLGQDEHGEIIEAISALAQAASEARADLLVDGMPQVSTFFGVVRRMDASAAEVESNAETRLVPRDTLERQGLAVLGQAVALFCEALPSGGSLVLPMPAVALETSTRASTASPWDIDEMDDGAISASILDPADHAWLERELAKEPAAVPLAPLRRE